MDFTSLKTVDAPREHKIQSPHPALQALLPRLAALSPSRRQRQLFRTREDAQKHLAELLAQPLTLLPQITPVWGIDHNDLGNSKPVGWSISEFPV